MGHGWTDPGRYLGEVGLEGVGFGYVDFAGLDAYSHIRFLLAFRFRHYGGGVDVLMPATLGVERLPEAEAVADGQQQEKKQDGATEALNHPKHVKPGERVESVVGVFYRPAL